MIKTPDELLKIMKAEAMGDLCFSHILDFIKVGMTELEVADEIERVLLALGAEGLSFPTICVSGTRTVSYTHLDVYKRQVTSRSRAVG